MALKVAMAAVIAITTLVAYWPAMHGSMLWDDDQHITKPNMRTIAGLGRIWTDPRVTEQYYPLSHSAFWLQSMIWGSETFGFHLVNVLTHLLNALLVWLALVRLRVPGAGLAAAIFALHPVQVESVAWITELKNTLSGALYLTAFLAYMRFEPFQPGPVTEGRSPSRKWRWYALALVLFVASLFAKTVSGSLPAAILVVAWWKQGGLQWMRRIPALIPFVGAALVMGMVTIHFEKNLWGAQGERFDFSPIERILIAGRAAWFYLEKLVWPTDLAFFYARWTIDGHQWWQYLYPLTALGLLGALWGLRHRLGRGPLAAVLFFGGTLVPALGFFNLFWQIYTFVCDHMQYLACIGVFALAAAGIQKLLDMLGTWNQPRGHLACVALLAALAGLSWRQSHVYINMEILWRDTLIKSPDMWMAHNNLGALLTNEGRFDEAELRFRDGLRLNPNSEHGHYNYANLLLKLNRLGEAVEHYLRAIEIRPNVADMYNNLGMAYSRQGLQDKALATIRRAVEINPAHIEARMNLGYAYMQEDRVDLALPQFREAMRQDSATVEFVAALARHYGDSKNDIAGALAIIELVLEFKPSDVELRMQRDRLRTRPTP